MLSVTIFAFVGRKSTQMRHFEAIKQLNADILKVHLLVTAAQQPIEFFVTPARIGDVEGLHCFDFDLPPGSRVY